MSSETTTIRIPSFFTLLTIVFITLKLAGIGVVSTWSWWWVLSPLWLPLGIVMAFLIVVALIALIAKLLS
jgi:predicted membrane channel-forming protein YqfA (hemolysin III family)